MATVSSLSFLAPAPKRNAGEVAFIVRFESQLARNSFYAVSGKEAGEAEDCARAMLRELVPKGARFSVRGVVVCLI